jgi:chorismate mutase/prephenate dehydratase
LEAALTERKADDDRLEQLRREIDDIDDRIVDLLERRAQTVSQVGEVKRAAGLPMHDPEREQRILDRLESQLGADASHTFPRTSVRSVFREIISACLSTQQQLTVAYFGPPGTFTHMAAQQAFGLAANYVQATNIPGVFDAVSRDNAAYGVAPIENSTEGSVNLTLDRLLETELLIRSELVLDVSQCLLGLHDDLGRIARVFSHPQALAQCRAWLAENLPHAQLVVSPSTAAAAREACADGAAAAVGSRLAGELNGLLVLREGIQDRSENVTRFVVLAKTDAPRTGHDKTSFVFATRHERGALRKALEILEQESLNLTRIESRPRRGKLWQYVFFADIEGHRADPEVARALERLDEHSGVVKILGSYPAAG